MPPHAARWIFITSLLLAVGCEYYEEPQASQCIEDNALCPVVPAECAQGRLIYTGADLAGITWSGAQLRCADLRGADLYGANLSGADLYGADLRGAELYGANLAGADLRDADLRCADLYGANLAGARLGGANIAAADLYGADLGAAQGAPVSEPTREKWCRPEEDRWDEHDD